MSGRSVLRRGLGGPGRPILGAATGEECDEPVGQQVHEVAEFGGTRAERLGDDLRVVARQDTGGTGEAHHADGHLRQRVGLRSDLQDVGCRIDQSDRRAEPHGVRRVLGLARPGQHPHGRVETEPPRVGAQPGQDGAARHVIGGCGGGRKDKGTRFLETPARGQSSPGPRGQVCEGGGSIQQTN